jgi:hypothetical protein
MPGGDSSSVSARAAEMSHRIRIPAAAGDESDANI